MSTIPNGTFAVIAVIAWAVALLSGYLASKHAIDDRPRSAYLTIFAVCGLIAAISTIQARPIVGPGLGPL